VNALHERINFLKNKIQDVQVTNEEEDYEIEEKVDVLKEELRDAMKKVDTQNENDFS